ncbi:T9SS type A sorting domain-containing protein [Polaribacter glomeratus]|uniref:Secretion system C-terminal sorting domain-containing protein n=1 Tax=Polaribacter glomeratus TaxID=102 RepID=A0A2S7WHQ3_9FLAO|nr:T9SS type A sorting domain-containing protein [Polaribacter glomeratus]PQJ77128.1 hypothetical protein BTO16_14885 [Polaribacter glomeratus]TXD67020.1 T9SS type A sorting domain-containing protein [Polaribacter glomeratus]
MKKSLHVFLLFFSIMAFSQATLPAYEGFDYTTPGKLFTINANQGQGNWTISDVTFAPNVDIIASPTWNVGGEATTGNAMAYSGPGESPIYSYTPEEGQTTVYVSFLLRVTALADTNLSTFLTTLKSPFENRFNAIVWYKKNPAEGATGYVLGINLGRGSGDVFYDTKDFQVGSDVLVVIKKVEGGAVSLFLNPDLGTEPSAPTVEDPTVRDYAFGQIFFRRDANDRTPSMIIDELRVGKEWADVVKSEVLSASTEAVVEIGIYPNPVSNGTLFINSKTNTSLEIYSVLGKKVLEKSSVSKSVDVSHLAKGCYILKIKNENNAVQTKKLMIQ